jgi:hypothetical protein
VIKPRLKPMSESFERLVEEARADRHQSTLPPSVRHKTKARPLVLLNAVLIPVVLLSFVPVLALYLLLFAPALPLVVTVLWLQMRDEWSQPETAVGLCTLTGFAIGYALLFWQHAPLLWAKVQALLHLSGS